MALVEWYDAFVTCNCGIVGDEVAFDELNTKIREILAVDGFGDILKEISPDGS